MTFPRVARHLLRLVEAACPPRLRTLDGLASDAAGTRRRLSPLLRRGVDRAAADPLPQRGIEALPGAIRTPLGEVVVNRLPGTKIPRQHPPLTPRPAAVENPVHDRSQVDGARTAPVRGGNQRPQYFPLFIRHVAWVGFAHPLFLGILPKQSLRPCRWSETRSNPG